MSFNLKANQTLTRKDLADAVHNELGLSHAESRALVDSIFEIVSAALVNGETVKLAKFGTFSTLDKGARPGRNIRTGETVTIAAKRILKFKASDYFAQRVDAALSTPES